MTKLKTLKDIQKYVAVVNASTGDADLVEEERDDASDRVIYLEDVKQEAIKDIKSIMELKKTPSDKWWEDMTGHRLTYSEEAKQGIIDYIKWKNNITEEELK